MSILYTPTFSDYEQSNILGNGEYEVPEDAIPNVTYSLDGIIISQSYRLTISSEECYQGFKYLNEKAGLVVIYNHEYRDAYGENHPYFKKKDNTWTQPLQVSFPQSVREWNEGEKPMSDVSQTLPVDVWTTGSFAIEELP